MKLDTNAVANRDFRKLALHSTQGGERVLFKTNEQ